MCTQPIIYPGKTKQKSYFCKAFWISAFCCSSCVEGATGNGCDLAKGGGRDAAALFRCATGTGNDNDMSDGGCVADPAASLLCSTGAGTGNVNDMSESGPGWAFLKVAEEPAASLRFASGISE